MAGNGIQSFAVPSSNLTAELSFRRAECHRLFGGFFFLKSKDFT
jgi:hypothetical protein